MNTEHYVNPHYEEYIQTYYEFALVLKAALQHERYESCQTITDKKNDYKKELIRILLKTTDDNPYLNLNTIEDEVNLILHLPIETFSRKV